MNVLKVIRDTDISGGRPLPVAFGERKAARAIIYDAEGKIALLHVSKKHYHKLPGGGIEEGEDIHAALRREALEEIGCAIENIRELGIVEEYRNEYRNECDEWEDGSGLHQISYCYVADVAGPKGAPALEDGEIADGFETEWMTADDAITALERERDVENYEGRFICLRDLTFLRAARVLISQSR